MHEVRAPMVPTCEHRREVPEVQIAVLANPTDKSAGAAPSGCTQATVTEPRNAPAGASPE